MAEELSKALQQSIDETAKAIAKAHTAAFVTRHVRDGKAKINDKGELISLLSNGVETVHKETLRDLLAQQEQIILQDKDRDLQNQLKTRAKEDLSKGATEANIIKDNKKLVEIMNAEVATQTDISLFLQKLPEAHRLKAKFSPEEWGLDANDDGDITTQESRDFSAKIQGLVKKAEIGSLDEAGQRALRKIDVNGDGSFSPSDVSAMQQLLEISSKHFEKAGTIPPIEKEAPQQLEGIKDAFSGIKVSSIDISDDNSRQDIPHKPKHLSASKSIV